MNFDEIQSAWQSAEHEKRLNIPVEMLLKEVQRNRHNFESRIIWRDIREVGAAAIVSGCFLYIAVSSGDWSFYLAAFSTAGVGVYMLVDRWIQRQRQPASNDSLQACIQASLRDVTHQIWLLKNIFWWYLLPLSIVFVAIIANLAWRIRQVPEFAFFTFSGIFVIFLLLAAVLSLCLFASLGVYRLNQRAVQKYLEPRRDELEALLASLTQ